MLTYRELLEYQKKAAAEMDIRIAAASLINRNCNNDTNVESISEEKNDTITESIHEVENDVSAGDAASKEKSLVVPGTIRDLLKALTERRVTIVLDAEQPPEMVEVEAVVGDLLIAETEDDKFKFVDIRCICEVIVDQEELLESLLNAVRT